MYSKKEAIELINKKLKELASQEQEFVLLLESTEETSFGWVFFFDSKNHVETGEKRYRIAGNGPILFDKNNGKIKFCSSGIPPEISIREYENELRRSPSSP